MKNISAKKILKGLALLSSVALMLAAGNIWWLTVPSNMVNRVTGLDLTYWGSDIVFKEDYSNPIGTSSKFIFRLDEQAYQDTLALCRINAASNEPGPPVSHPDLLRKIRDVNWVKDHLDQPFDCSYSYRGDSRLWSVALKSRYVFYTFSLH
ncbi:MAG: hypothetical protein COB37_04300 [Kordiimonadales bacterium]|nr:MAG: hypothetical protein COB37_04300 [Kordiimonadales bacterium]